MSSLRDGTIIVTGASRGIGAAIAQDLHGRGFQVAALSRSGTSGVGTAYACDVTDEAALRRVLTEIAVKGPITGLVNNAGIHTDAKSSDLSTADLEASFRMNVTAVFVACREVQPHMVTAGSGLIVNIGSFFDKMGVARNLAYCAGKAAVAAMTRCLAVEWARYDIRVMDIAPGYIATDLNREAFEDPRLQDYIKRRVPSRRAGKPEEVARLVGSLYDSDIAYLTGETIYLDGGHGMGHQ
jgi:NAD(P)-dependent dehydrogenase (short-subunit alcohol dehydrogenase family)